MRALAAIAALAGVAALLVTARGGGSNAPLGWTGYAPLNLCAGGAPGYTSYTYAWAKGRIVSEGARQIVCKRKP